MEQTQSLGTSNKEAAFTAAKKAMAAATWLAHPNPAAQLSLAVNASATHVGACLQQQKSPGMVAWEPLGFYSKKLDAAQVKYSAFD